MLSLWRTSGSSDLSNLKQQARSTRNALCLLASSDITLTKADICNKNDTYLIEMER